MTGTASSHPFLQDGKGGPQGSEAGTAPRPCPACGEEKARAFAVCEHMLGLGTEFSYGKCPSCGTVFLLDPPENLSAYYADSYLPFVSPARSALPGPARAARHLLDRALGIPLPRRLTERLPAHYMWFAGRRLAKDTPILDVGCGRGVVLRRLARAGFENLTGVDRFHKPEAEGLFEFHQGELGDVPGRFGLIMFHHSLEHVLDPLETLATARELLDKDGQLLVRLPVAGSEAQAAYGEHWAHLDAPRHFTLFTVDSFRLGAAKVGLRVERVFFDSDGLGWWGSELYRAGRPLSDVDTYFSPAELRAFKARARSCNRRGTGDSAGFWLRAG